MTVCVVGLKQKVTATIGQMSDVWQENAHQGRKDAVPITRSRIYTREAVLGDLEPDNLAGPLARCRKRKSAIWMEIWKVGEQLIVCSGTYLNPPEMHQRHG